MKRLITALLCLVLALCPVFTAAAAGGRVSYSGNAGDFVFESGSEYSLTDLFPDLKDVMPGDSLTQKITLKNLADKKVKVKVYLRSLGAHEDSVEFLSQLGLRVKKSEDNKAAYMFDAAADQTDGLTDWVYLGTLYSGGEIDLDVSLEVPTALDNRFQSRVGYLDWQFKVEELPVETGDPSIPDTGDYSGVGICIAVCLCCLCAVIILLTVRKKKKD